jgi:hypothetical protein
MLHRHDRADREREQLLFPPFARKAFALAVGGLFCVALRIEQHFADRAELAEVAGLHGHRRPRSANDTTSR